jgi:hypothetical protein
MIQPQQLAYNSVYSWVDSCVTDFHFKAAGTLIELFGKQFPDMVAMKMNLIDLYHDKYLESNKQKEELKKIA